MWELISRSYDFMVAHEQGHHLIEVANALKDVVLEDCGELVLNRSEQCDEVEGIDLQVAAQISLEAHLLHLQDLEVSEESQDAGFNLTGGVGTSLRSRVGKSSGWVSKLGISLPAWPRCALVKNLLNLSSSLPLRSGSCPSIPRLVLVCLKVAKVRRRVLIMVITIIQD